MTAHEQNDIGVEEVEMLLKQRRLLREPLHYDVLVKMADVISGNADQETRRTVDRHLSSCESCRETLLMLRAAEEPLGDRRVAEPFPRRTLVKRLRRFAPLAAAAVFVGALSLLLTTVEEPSEDATARFLTKGAEDTITVAVRRGTHLFTARHLDTLAAGDHLGFFYSSKNAGYLALFARDGEGKVSVLFPGAGDGSAPIDPGESISLPDGAVVEQGKGCEWIVGVFSDRVLSIRNLTDRIEQAKETDETCGLSLDIPYSRAHYAIAFKR